MENDLSKLEQKINMMVSYAWEFLKTPYRWGGGDFTHYDCSGYVQEVLQSVNFDIPGDQTAQTLHDHLKETWVPKIERGSVLFFGKSLTSISHTALALDDLHMIEAGGGNQWTRTDEDAKKANAFVRVRPIARRKDLLLGLYPKE